MELKYFIRKPKLVLWGCGAIINKVLRYASEVDAQIEECVDSAVEKQGKMLSDVCGGGGEDILIKSPSILEDLTKGYHVIVLVQKCSDVCTELERMGYKRGETYECITFDEIAAEIENFEIIWACDRLCETKKCSVAFILFPHTVDIQNRSRLENALSGFDDMVEDRIGYLKSNPPYIALTHQELPYYSGEYIENIFTGKNPYRSSRGDVIQEEHKSQYVNVVNGMFE